MGAFLVLGWRARLAGAAVAIAVVGIALWQDNYTLWARLDLWLPTFEMWLHAPWGVGLGGFEHNYHSLADADQRWLGKPWSTVNEIGLLAGAAHNEYLEALAVLGVPGIALILLGAIYGQPFTQGRERETCTLAIAAILATVGFPLQNPVSAFLIAWSLGRLYAHEHGALVSDHRRHRLRLVGAGNQSRGHVQLCAQAP